MKFHLLRIVRSIFNPRATTPGASAGRASSEAILSWSAGGRVGNGKDGRPAAYRRRTYAAHSWDRPGGQKWQWGANGKLRMKTLDMIPKHSRLIVVVAPGVSSSPETNRQAWNALAPIAAHRRTPYSRLFIGSRA